MITHTESDASTKEDNDTITHAHLKDFGVHLVDAARRVGRLVEPADVAYVLHVLFARVKVVQVEFDARRVAVPAAKIRAK